MHRRILLTLALSLFVGQFATAQLPETGFSEITTAAPQPQHGLRDTLEEGYSLERQRLWADALVHYEDAARKFPSSVDISQRLQIVRIRFDLSRRYSDRSFVGSTKTLTVPKADREKVSQPRAGLRHQQLVPRHGDDVAVQRPLHAQQVDEQDPEFGGDKLQPGRQLVIE